MRTFILFATMLLLSAAAPEMRWDSGHETAHALLDNKGERIGHETFSQI